MGFSVWKSGLAITWRFSLLAVILMISIPTSDCNEFIVGNSNAFDKPFFTQEPEDYYYIVKKNKPITVTCEAVRADEILIKCSDVYVTDITRTEVHVDRLTKVKTITASVDVTKDDLEEYFGSDTYWCECDAIANVQGSKSQLRTVSKRGLVQAAFLRRRFEREPISVRVAIDSSAVLPCLPPEGRPRPEVFWLKDGDEIDVRRTNHIVSSEGDLMIGQVKLGDMGNYTCGARNILTKRLSDFATLTVFVNGGWSTWSPWTECSTKCGKGTQRRSRTCSNPTPLNGGTVCSGEPVQKLSCNSICPVKGQWSPWSSWSTCNPDCIYHRRRSCDNPRPANGGGFCNGNDLDSSNCTGGMCRDRNRGFYPINGPEKEATATAESGDENIAMYIGLCVAVVVFAMLIVVIVVVIRRWKKHQLLDANHAGLSDDEKKVNKNGTDMMSVQPDLTQTVVTVAHHSNSPSPTIDPPSPNNNHVSSTENIYDKPDFNLEHRLSLGKNSKTLFVEPTINLNRNMENLPLNDQNAMSHVTNSSPTAPELPPRPHSESDNIIDSRHSMMSVQLPSNIDSDAVTWGTFNHMGGRLMLPESGVTLTVPEGAIKKGQTEELFLAICRDDKDRPKLSDRQTILSTVVLCGPSHVSLKKPVVISLQHCANMRQGGWMLSICHSDSALDEAPEWLRTVTLGQETINTPVYAQLDPNHCHIMTEFLRRYTLIGESVPGGRPVKILRLAAFAPQAPPSMDFSIRVYVVEDTQDALEGVIQEEKKFGGRLLDKPKQIPFQDGGHNLCLTIEELSPGWRSKLAANYQEIPFQHIWSGNQNNLHCSFSLEMIDRAVHKISCKIQVYQKAILSNRQVLHIYNNFNEKSASCQTPSSTLKGRSSTVTTNSSSGFSSMVTLDREPAVQGFRLPSHVRHMLCMLLDPPNVRGNDWRMLAQALTVDRYVQFFATKKSPTEHILDLWEARHREESAITDLMNIFRVMGRMDAAAVLEKDMGAWL